MDAEPLTSTSTGLLYEVTAYAGKSRLKITTRDIDYIRRHVQRHMSSPFRRKVPPNWYAMLDGYLNEAMASGRVDFKGYSGIACVISARVVPT
jgi:hypothetical protein